MKKKILSMVLSLVVIGTGFLQVSAFADSSLDIYTIDGSEYISLEAMKDLGVNIDRQSDGDAIADFEGDNVKINVKDTLKENDTIYIPMKETLEELEFKFDFDGSKWTIEKEDISKIYSIGENKQLNKKLPIKATINKNIKINDRVKITDEKGEVIGYVNTQYAKELQQLIDKYGSEFKLKDLKVDVNVETKAMQIQKPIKKVVKQPQILEVSLDDLKVEMNDISNKVFNLFGAYYIDMSALNELDINFMLDDEDKIVGITNQLNNKENKSIICDKNILDIKGSKYIEIIDNLKELDVQVEKQDNTFIITNGDTEITVPIYDLR